MSESNSVSPTATHVPGSSSDIPDDLRRNDEESNIRGGNDSQHGSNNTQLRKKDETEKGGDEWVVKWDGPDDPECPLNLPSWKKWYIHL